MNKEKDFPVAIQEPRTSSTHADQITSGLAKISRVVKVSALTDKLETQSMAGSKLSQSSPPDPSNPIRRSVSFDERFVHDSPNNPFGCIAVANESLKKKRRPSLSSKQDYPEAILYATRGEKFVANLPSTPDISPLWKSQKFLWPAKSHVSADDIDEFNNENDAIITPSTMVKEESSPATNVDSSLANENETSKESLPDGDGLSTCLKRKAHHTGTSPKPVVKRTRLNPHELVSASTSPLQSVDGDVFYDSEDDIAIGTTSTSAIGIVRDSPNNPFLDDGKDGSPNGHETHSNLKLAMEAKKDMALVNLWGRYPISEDYYDAPYCPTSLIQPRNLFAAFKQEARKIEDSPPNTSSSIINFLDLDNDSDSEQESPQSPGLDLAADEQNKRITDYARPMKRNPSFTENQNLRKN